MENFTDATNDAAAAAIYVDTNKFSQYEKRKQKH